MFSVVIPSRTRGDTLPFTIESCLNQSQSGTFEWEVLVFDNASEDDTATKIALFNHPRIRYEKIGTPLCMADSWETAIGLARGEYIVLVGADDALLPGCLATLEVILRQHPGQVVSWATAGYHWPSSGEVQKRNILQIPLGQTLRRLNSASVLKAVLQFRIGYEMLPTFYNSCIPRTLIEEARRATGRAIHASAPDISSGMMFASLTKSYLYLNFPLSVAATSGASNGASILKMRDVGITAETKAAREFLELSAKAQMSFHESLPQVPLLAVQIADAFIRAWSSLGRDPVGKVNMKAFKQNCYAELGYSSEPVKSEWAGILASYFKQTTPVEIAPAGKQHLRLGYNIKRQVMHLDMSNWGIKDACQAAAFSDKLVNPLAIVGDLEAMPPARLSLGRKIKRVTRLLWDGEGES
ncbi:glycosyltransferase family A protein [Prosthecobacter sp. SYSU 5D2]|uniref:glycosyltransferase family 2 protein n=1 Tax=Prosthecobacter sp. SYSU 5D2 TaxID=3134134 RepID=UPI0031FE5C25